MPRQPRYIDLFSGCGGLSLGLHMAGWRGIFAVEKSPDAFETLKHNLIDKRNHFDWPKWLKQSNHDINDVLIKHKPRLKALRGRVDMVVGGPPCQGFSTAGLRKESDVRNGLIRSYLKFIMYVRPKMIFFENVKGFTLQFKKNKSRSRKLKSKGIAYSDYVVRVLSFLGYDVYGKMVNFGAFGVPQKRTRFILVAVRKDVAAKKQKGARAFFQLIKKCKKGFLLDRELPLNPTLGNAISDLLNSNGVVPTSERPGFSTGVYTTIRSKYQKYMRHDCNLPAPDSHSFANHTKDVKSRMRYIIKHQTPNKNLNETIREKFHLNKHTVILLDSSSKAPTITTLPDDYIHYSEPRILTVREYARIQSFPDWFQFQGKYTTGGKQRTKEVPRYTQVGNAIPPLFAEQSGVILKQLVQ